MTKRRWLQAAMGTAVGTLLTLGCELPGTDPTSMDSGAGGEAPSLVGGSAGAPSGGTAVGGAALPAGGSGVGGVDGVGGAGAGTAGFGPVAGAVGSSGMTGEAGSNGCAAGQVPCGASCVDGQTDVANCGACGALCGAGQACQAGQCQCMDGLNRCGAACVNTSSDATHCGMCDRACAMGEVCSAGQCATHCGDAQTQCGQACVDTNSSASHCGSCGTACSGGSSCSSGSCQCPSDQTLCSGTCVNTQTSVSHCGTCGNACAAGAMCSNGNCSGAPGGPCNFGLPTYENGNGSVTFYTLDMGSAEVNCSFPILQRNPDRIAYVHTGGGEYFAAMNTADYNNAAVCGACIEVSRDDGRRVTATVVDQCPIGSNPKCVRGHVDLSRNAFTQLGTTAEGYLGTGNGGSVGRISWRYIPCPLTSNVTYRLKEPSNQNWNEILVGNTLTPIKGVEAMISGTWRAGTRQSYNYWSVNSGNLGTAPWRARVTDVRNNQLEVSLSPGQAEHVSSSQFPSCQ